MKDKLSKKKDLVKTEVEVGEIQKDPYPHIVPSGISYATGMTGPFSRGPVFTSTYNLDPDQITRLRETVAEHGPFDPIYDDEDDE